MPRFDGKASLWSPHTPKPHATHHSCEHHTHSSAASSISHGVACTPSSLSHWQDACVTSTGGNALDFFVQVPTARLRARLPPSRKFDFMCLSLSLALALQEQDVESHPLRRLQ